MPSRKPVVATKSGTKAFDLGIVKHRAIGLVTQQALGGLRQARADEVGGDVDKFRTGDARRLGHGVVDLVPGQHLVRRNVKGMIRSGG